MNDIKFIPKDIIVFFYKQLVKIYDGSFGIRDENLLNSALEQPKATYQGEYLHDSLLKMAAAYGYHLCNNHPFIDGTKRIAFVAMDTFLQRNGLEITASEKEAYKMMIQVSSDKLSKKELTIWLENNTNSID
ncbi:type II toxin-antitoxin system death-on-curing family toxin [Halanaerobium sp. Z-7514]|uniref:Type II toxin-antitoxin system death-on-curing family toxin n=1 Tax=Halanaerobium polyolivorans TaxID=2886943 RepID=A0AAW4X2E1_9FIRM|nr:type II toxin-antitoxin system death-on-curing family toxin [Halanaerobium polyolivorans]MCC3145981.1 type II toxin-antitoxin system death-on-curing family toxin [Halanaerobium polyolivorans]